MGCRLFIDFGIFQNSLGKYKFWFYNWVILVCYFLVFNNFSLLRWDWYWFIFYWKGNDNLVENIKYCFGCIFIVNQQMNFFYTNTAMKKVNSICWNINNIFKFILHIIKNHFSLKSQWNKIIFQISFEN